MKLSVQVMCRFPVETAQTIQKLSSAFGGNVSATVKLLIDAGLETPQIKKILANLPQTPTTPK